MTQHVSPGNSPGARTWNKRFSGSAFIYGTEPNAFLVTQAALVPPHADVVELGAGEGRNAVWLAQQGHRVTVVDYATEGLAKATRLARERGVTLDPIEADVTAWQPDRTWDAVVATYLHLPPPDRPTLYRLVQRILKPGGVFIAEWFRPEQITGGYKSGGPPSAEYMVTAEELAAHFSSDGILVLEEVETELQEGTHHRGPAAVVRIVWRKP